MKPSRPAKKGIRKFINKVAANSSHYRKIATGDLLTSHGTETAFIALPNTNFTVGSEFLKTRDMDGAINIAMSDFDGWMKGVALTRLENNGPLRLMPLSFQPYMRNIQISEEVAYGFHAEAITDSNDWYIKLIATDGVAGSSWSPFIYVGPDAVFLPPGDSDGDGLDDEEQEEIEEGITNGNIPALNPMPETESGQMPQQTPPAISNNIDQNNNQASTLELVLHKVLDENGDELNVSERQLGKTYPLNLTFMLRTTRDSVIADEVNYYEDYSMGLLESLSHPTPGPSGRTKHKMWVIENIEISDDGDYTFVFEADKSGFQPSMFQVSISYGEEVIEEAPEAGGSGSEGAGSETGGETGTGDGGGSVAPPVTLITLDSTVDNSDGSEVTGTLSAPSTITFSGTLDGTVTSVYSSTGDVVTDNSDGTWTMTKEFTTDGVQSITFYATDGSETQSVVGSVTLMSQASSSRVQQAPIPVAPPVDGGTVATNQEDPEALDIVGTSYVIEDLTTDSPLVTIAIKIKLTEETPVFTFSNSNGSVTVSATQVTASGRLFDNRQTVLFEDLNANFLNGEWLHLVMVFDKVWSGGYSGGGDYWRSYGAINGVTFEKVLEGLGKNNSWATRRNLFNDGTLEIGPGDFTFKHLEVIPGFAATPDQIAHFWNSDVNGGVGYLYQSIATVAAGTTVEPIYDANMLFIDSAEYQNRTGVVEFDSGILTYAGGREYKNGQAFEFFKSSPHYQNGKTWAAGFWIDTSYTGTAWQTIFAKHTHGGSNPDGWTFRVQRASSGLYNFRLTNRKNNSAVHYTASNIDVGDGYISLLLKVKWELNDNLEIFIKDFQTPVYTTTLNKDGMARSQTYGFDAWPLGDFQKATNDGPALLTIGENFLNAPNGRERLQGAISYLKGFHGITDAGMDQQLYNEIQASIGDIIIPQLTVDQAILTNQANFQLSGESVDCAQILIDGVAATIDQNGNWTISPSLTEGENILTITAIGPSGIEEEFTTTITLDTITPIIQVKNPMGEFSSDGDTVTLPLGTTWSPAVSADDGVSQVVESAVYDSSQLGQQTITYTCQDESGNVSQPITVTYVFEEVQVQHLEETAIVDSSSIITNGVLAVSAYQVDYNSNAPKNQAVLENSHLYNFQEMQTISVWFRYEGTGRTTLLLVRGTSGGTIPRLYIKGTYALSSTHNLLFKWPNRNPVNVGNVAGYNDGNWHHVVFSWKLDGRMARTWFDGNLIRDAYTADIRAPHVGATEEWNLLSDGRINNTVAFKVMDGLTVLNTFADDSLVQQLRTYQPTNLDNLFILTENNQTTFNLYQEVSGFTLPNYKIYSNGVEVATANAQGNFTFTLNLVVGQNNYDFVANDGLGGADTNIYSHSIESQAGEWVEEMAEYPVENVSTLLQNGVLVSSGLAAEPVNTPIGYVINDVSNQPREVSISMWVKLDPTTPSVVNLLDSTASNHLFRLSLNGNSFKLGGSTTAYSTNGQITANVQSAYHFENISTIHNIDLRDNQWHNIIVCFERRDSTYGNFIISPTENNGRTRATIFVDGILASSHILINAAYEENTTGASYPILNPKTFTAPFILASTNAQYEIDSMEIKRDVHLTQKQAEWLYDSGLGRGVKKLEDASSQIVEDLNPSGLYELGDFFFDSSNASNVGSGPTLVANKTYRVTSNNYLRLPVRAETLFIPEYGQNAKTLSFFAKFQDLSELRVVSSSHGGAASGGGLTHHNIWIGVDRTTDPTNPAPYIKTSRPYADKNRGGNQNGYTPVIGSLPGGIDFQDDSFHKHTFVFSNGTINYYVDSQHIAEITFQRPLYNSVGVFDWFKGNADIFNVKFQGGTDLNQLSVVDEVPIYIYRDGLEVLSDYIVVAVGDNPTITTSTGGLSSNIASTINLDTSAVGTGSATFTDQITGSSRTISIEVREFPENTLDLTTGTFGGSGSTLNGNTLDVVGTGGLIIPHSSDYEITQSSTLSAWINPDTIKTSNNQTNWFLNKWVPTSNNKNYGYAIGVSKSPLSFVAGENATRGYIRIIANDRANLNGGSRNYYFNFPTTNALVVGEWFHTTVQFKIDAGVWSMRAFVNGELLTSGGNSVNSIDADGWIRMTSGIDQDTSAVDLGIGWMPAFPTNVNKFNGQINNVVIEPSLLTEQEVHDLYSLGN